LDWDDYENELVRTLEQALDAYFKLFLEDFSGSAQE
jgi:hypothetical protein